MDLQDRIRSWVLRGMVKAASLPVPLTSEWERVQWMKPTFRSLCVEGVRANGIVFNCLSTIVFAYPEPKLCVYREGNAGLEPLPNHPAQTLLNRPNPQMGQAELLQYIALYKGVGGNCYLYKVRSKARRVVELLPLNDSQIVPVAGATLPIDHYNWVNEEGGLEVPIPAEDIVHLKWMPDPLAPWRGLAPLMAVAREVDVDSEARRYLFALLKHDCIPRVVLIAPPGSKPLSPDEHKRYTEQFQEKYGGDNRGKPLLLGGGLDVKIIGLNLQELAFEALSRVPEARIAGAFRVPPVMAYLNVGLEQLTYNNAAGMRRFFTEDCLVPLWTMDAAEIAADLLPEFGDPTGLTVQFDTSNVMALQEATAEKRAWVDNAIKGSYVTVNEGRAQLGLAPVADGDVFLRGPLIVAVPALAAPPAAKALPAPRQTKSKEERRTGQIALIAAQRANREQVAKRMESGLDSFFGGLADRVIHRALEQGKALRTKADDTDWVGAYEDGVPHWAVDLTPSLFAQQFAEELREAGSKAVLEIGCGNGRDSIFFARAGFTVTAIDLAPGAVDLARANAAEAGVSIDVRVGNAEQLPFADAAFDAVFSLSVLHASNLALSIPEVARVLKPGGLCLVHLYGDTTKADGTVEEHISVDAFLGLVKGSFEVLDFYAEQEDEADEYGEKHRVMVAHLRRLEARP